MSLVVTICQKPDGRPSLGEALIVLEQALAPLDVEWSCRPEPEKPRDDDGWRAADMEDAHGSGCHDELPRDGCPECDRRRNRW